MPQEHTRRNVLKGGLALAGLGALGLPEWVLPALAQGETLVPFTDIPANANFTPAADRRTLDIRKIDGPFTPKDQFFTTQHYGHPDVDPGTFRLKISGLVDKPKSLSLDELKKIGNSELIAGFECSGNRRPLQGLSGNGRWSGVSTKIRTRLHRREIIGPGIRVLWRRSWFRRRRVPNPEIYARLQLWQEPRS
jgi:DMSO/TMAO reductase YedYZ molybdopterin-dependent catalytic subunit